MIDFTKYNRQEMTQLTDTTAQTWDTLENVYKTMGERATHYAKAMYISDKSKYGPQAVVITPKNFLPLPRHMLETVQNILKDKEAVEAMRLGMVGFKIRQYTSHNKECYTIDFVNIK